VFFAAASLPAYDGGAVSDGGSIAVAVKFKGAAPAPKKLDVSKDKEVCAKTPKLDSSLMVSGGNVANAVVYISDIKKGKKMAPTKVTLDQKGCEYHPHVLAFPVGSTVEIVNPDGVLHNVHTYIEGKTLFNRAQPPYKKVLPEKIDKRGPINVKCDVHGWMDGWLFGAENPYFGVTDKNGTVKLTDVPPGTYTVEIWHETLGKQTQKVTVKAKDEAKVSVELAKK
jgi:plastocyanin